MINKTKWKFWSWSSGNYIRKFNATIQVTSWAPGRPSLDTSRGFSGGKQSWKKSQMVEVRYTKKKKRKKEHFSTSQNKPHLKSMNSGFNRNLRLGKGSMQILALRIHGVVVKMKNTTIQHHFKNKNTLCGRGMLWTYHATSTGMWCPEREFV